MVFFLPLMQCCTGQLPPRWKTTRQASHPYRNITDFNRLFDAKLYYQFIYFKVACLLLLKFPKFIGTGQFELGMNFRGTGIDGPYSNLRTPRHAESIQRRRR